MGLLSAAAGDATGRVPLAAPTETVGDVRAALPGQKLDDAGAVVVLSDDKVPVGLVPIARLLTARAEARIGDIMDADPPVVRPGTPPEPIARRMIDRKESCVAVVDDRNRFRGLIPGYRMLSVLLTEHDEDVARLGGYLASTRRARHAAEEVVTRRLLHRLPWLMIGLIGAMASAGIVGAFESQLDARVLLAFFLPGVVYMADAVGTQTEAVLIRGLSAGVTVRSVVWRELGTGLAVGLAIGAAFLPFALVAWGDATVAVAVAVALVASCSIATIVAMALPALFQRLGRDPAFGSGPLATVIQDLLSIVAYLAIATQLVD